MASWPLCDYDPWSLSFISYRVDSLLKGSWPLNKFNWDGFMIGLPWKKVMFYLFLLIVVKEIFESVAGKNRWRPIQMLLLYVEDTLISSPLSVVFESCF